MEVTFCKAFGWEDALDAARTTANKSIIQKEPSEAFKRKLLASEHSPIRCAQYIVRVDNVPKWVTTHIVRHHNGIEKFVGTQRTDRTGSKIPRDEHPQGEPTAILIEANAQALINISHSRLCHTASPETIEYWKKVLAAIATKDPIVVDYCVPPCIYRGICPEEKSCGYWRTVKGINQRHQYLELIGRSSRESK